MLIENLQGPAPISPGEVRIHTNPSHLQEHLALSASETEQAIEACINGDANAENLIPVLRLRRDEVIRRTKERLINPVDASRMFRLYNMLASIGVLIGVGGMAQQLASRQSMIRRMAAVTLPGLPFLAGFSIAQVRGVIEGSELARGGLRAMLFEPDRWNRRIAVELCLRLGIEIPERECRLLLAESPDPRGETACVLQYLFSKGWDLGGVDVLERLLYPDEQGYELQRIFLQLPQILRNSSHPAHDRVLQLLEHFVASRHTPLSVHFEEMRRYNDVANAIEAIAASPSERVIEIANAVLRVETAVFPRSCAWAVLIERVGLDPLGALLESETNEKTVEWVLNKVFSDRDEQQTARQLDWARRLLECPWGSRAHERATLFIRQHAERPDQVAANDPDHVDFDRMSAVGAAQYLIQLGVINSEEAAGAMQAAESKARPGHAAAEVLNAAALVTMVDVESPHSPPIYSRLLGYMRANSRGRFEVSAVRQIWYKQSEDRSRSTGVVQYVCNDSLIEFGVHDYGDYYDMRAVLAAANQTIERAGHAERFVPLGAGDQIAVLAFCVPDRAEALARIIGLELMRDPDDAMRAGRAFENAVRGSHER